jgi:DNA topoisomerase-1
VKHGAVNANVPKGADPAALTLPEAVELLAARADKGPAGRPARRAAKAKAPAKKKSTAKRKKA